MPTVLESLSERITRPFVVAALLLAASMGALGTAFIAQYWGGLEPCPLCLYHRVPFFVGGALALAAMILNPRIASRARGPLLALVGLGFAVNAGIALYHVGVENHWWASAVCGGGPPAIASAEDLRRALAQPAPKATAAPAAVATQAPAPTKAPEPTAAPKVEPTQPKPTDTPKPAPSPTPEPPKPTAAPTQPPAPSGADGANLIFDAMRAQLASKSFRMTMNTEDGDKKTTMTIEYVAPDRFHMIQASGTEIILLKEGMYQRSTKDGPWNKLPGEMGSNIVTTILDPKNIEELKNTVSVDQVKFLGPELLDGKLMWVYQYTTAVKMGDTTLNGTAKVWIGVLDKLPYRSESESDSLVNKGGKTKTTSVYQYDPNIKIEAPVQ